MVLEEVDITNLKMKTWVIFFQIQFGSSLFLLHSEYMATIEIKTALDIN
jgi:hypothetical protein